MLAHESLDLILGVLGYIFSAVGQFEVHFSRHGDSDARTGTLHLDFVLYVAMHFKCVVGGALNQEVRDRWMM